MALDANAFQRMHLPTQTATHSDVRAAMTPVRFTATCPPYAAGETASFLPADAAALITAGLATRRMRRRPPRPLTPAAR
jgi:hypothetical protein